MGLVRSGQVIVADLRPEGVIVAGCFKRNQGIVAGRAVKGGRKIRRKDRRALLNGNVNGNVNGNEDKNDVEGGDVNMNGHAEDVEEDSEEDVKVDQVDNEAWIKCLAASEDGQWLAIGDLAGSIAVFSLDTMRVSDITHSLAVLCLSGELAPCCLTYFAKPSSISQLSTRASLPPQYPDYSWYPSILPYREPSITTTNITNSNSKSDHPGIRLYPSMWCYI
jgi:hypothetical protein